MEDREKRVGCSESIDRKIHDYSPRLPTATAFLTKGMQSGTNSTILRLPYSRVYKLYEFNCVALI